jgi:phosphoribosylformimino-5-aminoimidazole carboxamide ribotide isomerase
VVTQSASRFEILPAIDVRGGRVVRLEQGAFDRETVFDDDPGTVARRFRRARGRWVHVVDLDGARTGERRVDGALQAVLAASIEGDDPPMRVQAAGGLRDTESVASALSLGVARVVLGTVALEYPRLVEELVERHGTERIAVALDVRDGLAVGHGWVPGTPGTPVDDAVARLGDAGVSTFAVTAIDRDGLLGGPDLALLDRVVRATSATVIASGGISTLEDLAAVHDTGCGGAIVGRALYVGAIDLATAVETFSSTSRPAGPSIAR